MSSLKKFVKLTNIFLLSLSAFIGVGFISGAEIWTFFARFGENFIISIVILFLLLFIFCNKIILMCNSNENLNKLQEMHKIGQKNTKLTKNNIKEFLLNLEIFLFAGAMFSGLRDVVYELFVSNQVIIFLCSVFLVFVMTICGVKAISRMNFLIIGSFFVVIVILVSRDDIFNKSSVESLLSISRFSVAGVGVSVLFSVMYIFMNMAHLVPIFKVSDCEMTKRERLVFSLIFSIVFCFLIIILTLFLGVNSYLSAESMPIFKFFQNIGGWLIVFFSIVIIGGLLSTLMVCLIGLNIEVKKYIKNHFYASFLVVFFPLLMGFLPFNFFVNIIYPLAGVLNFIALVIL